MAQSSDVDSLSIAQVRKYLSVQKSARPAWVTALISALLSFSLLFSFEQTLFGFYLCLRQSCPEKAFVQGTQRSAAKFSQDAVRGAAPGSVNMKGKSDRQRGMENVVGGL